MLGRDIYSIRGTLSESNGLSKERIKWAYALPPNADVLVHALVVKTSKDNSDASYKRLELWIDQIYSELPKVGSDGEPIEEASKAKLVSEQINISLTLNNQEWIEALPFKYHDISLTRLAYVHNYREDLVEEEERTAAWLAEEPEEPLPEEITEEELKKREEDKKKKAAEETEEVATMAKRKGAKMYLYGENIIKS